jgi:hypothetical protein
MQKGKRTLVLKSGHYMKLMDALDGNQWEAIVKLAEALVKAPKPELFKDLEPEIPYSSDVEIIDCDSDDSDEEDADMDMDEAADEDATELDDVKTDFGGDEPEDCDLEA